MINAENTEDIERKNDAEARERLAALGLGGDVLVEAMRIAKEIYG